MGSSGWARPTPQQLSLLHRKRRRHDLGSTHLLVRDVFDRVPPFDCRVWKAAQQQLLKVCVRLHNLGHGVLGALVSSLFSCLDLDEQPHRTSRHRLGMYLQQLQPGAADVQVLDHLHLAANVDVDAGNAGNAGNAGTMGRAEAGRGVVLKVEGDRGG